MSQLLRLAAIVAILGMETSAHGAGRPTLELTIGDLSRRGYSARHTREHCWLIERDGRLHTIPLEQVTAFRKVDDAFRPASSMDVKQAVAKELGRSFEVATRGRYVVAAPRGRADAYAALFDETSRGFQIFFSRRGFHLREIEFPLVAIVFPTRAAFLEYADGDGVASASGIFGYYSRMTNRVALFDETTGTTSAARQSAIDGMAAIDAGIRDTIIHEGTHQLAFNRGLHSRLGENPKWITEGLALLFENSGGIGGAQRQQSDRINTGRHLDFVRYRQERREANSLADYVCNDQAFKRSMSDGYAEAWALTFYLAEKHRAAFSEYLQTIAARESVEDYTAEERLRDFQSAFGKDVAWREVEFLRFIDGLPR